MLLFWKYIPIDGHSKKVAMSIRCAYFVGRSLVLRNGQAENGQLHQSDAFCLHGIYIKVCSMLRSFVISNFVLLFDMFLVCGRGFVIGFFVSEYRARLTCAAAPCLKTLKCIDSRFVFTLACKNSVPFSPSVN